MYIIGFMTSAFLSAAKISEIEEELYTYRKFQGR